MTVRPRLSSAPSRYRFGAADAQHAAAGEGGHDRERRVVERELVRAALRERPSVGGQQPRLQARVGGEHVGQLVPPSLAGAQVQAQALHGGVAGRDVDGDRRGLAAEVLDDQRRLDRRSGRRARAAPRTR